MNDRSPFAGAVPDGEPTTAVEPQAAPKKPRKPPVRRTLKERIARFDDRLKRLDDERQKVVKARDELLRVQKARADAMLEEIEAATGD